MNVTATDVAVTQAAEVVVVAVPAVVEAAVPEVVDGDPPDGVWLVGKALVGAVEYVPNAEVAEHCDGTLVAVETIHGYGTTAALRAAIVRNAA